MLECADTGKKAFLLGLWNHSQLKDQMSELVCVVSPSRAERSGEIMASAQPNPNPHPGMDRTLTNSLTLTRTLTLTLTVTLTPALTLTVTLTLTPLTPTLTGRWRRLATVELNQSNQW